MKECYFRNADSRSGVTINLRRFFKIILLCCFLFVINIALTRQGVNINTIQIMGLRLVEKQDVKI